MSVYQVSNFTFSYPFSAQQISLSGTFNIEAGECILLQGASGSGKSTLLAALKGLIPHLIAGNLSGEIKFHNQHIAELNEQSLLKIGYLQQNPDSQLICPDVYAELAFGLENQGFTTKTIDDKIMTITEKFALSHLLCRKVNSLSGGEKQKINLLAILLLEPEVLLLDEPTALLDPQSASQIMQIVAEYIQNKTVIIIEHNLHYLQNLVNRSLYIDENGQIITQNLEQINWQQYLPEQKCKHYNSNQTNYILDIKHLNYSYDTKRKLLNKLDLQVHRGEVISILGENGTGKSTLLKLIAGIIPSTQMIYWQQQDIAKFKKIQWWEQISLLWQNPETHFLFNRVDEEINQSKTLDEFNLSAQANQNPFTLSEGQKRRLSLAIALNNQPQLILLDEPSFGQDHTNKLRLIESINQLAMNGMSFIIISHDLNFVNAISQKVYELRNGELITC